MSVVSLALCILHVVVVGLLQLRVIVCSNDARQYSGKRVTADMGMVLLLVVALNDVLECRFNIAARGAAAAIICV